MTFATGSSTTSSWASRTGWVHQSLDVDAIYVPTDNNVVSGLASVVQVAEEKKIPLVVGEGDSVKVGGIITYGIDHHSKNRTPVEDKLAFELEFQGFNHNDPQENHMASYVDFLLESWLHLRAGEERLRAESVVDALGKYPRPITLSNFVAFDVVGC